MSLPIVVVREKRLHSLYVIIEQKEENRIADNRFSISSGFSSFQTVDIFFAFAVFLPRFDCRFFRFSPINSDATNNCSSTSMGKA